MNVVYISGSPRDNSNTDYLLNLALSIADGQFVKLTDYRIEPCRACWACQKLDRCIIDDDMSNILIPMLLEADAVVLGSPVYFNNVSAQAKAFIDRTWCIRGQLRNKIGGAITVGRRYGAESAISAINAFFLKHEMIPANRGVSGIAFEEGGIQEDKEAVESAKKLGERIKELASLTVIRDGITDHRSRINDGRIHYG
jgi:multimeric flavodoxin WrbA